MNTQEKDLGQYLAILTSRLVMQKPKYMGQELTKEICLILVTPPKHLYASELVRLKSYTALRDENPLDL